MVKYRSLVWFKGEPWKLVKGVKGNRIPKGAVYGGNGSFVVHGKPAALNLTYEDEEGTRTTINIISDVKEINGWKKLSENRVDKLRSKFEALGCFNLKDLHTILIV